MNAKFRIVIPASAAVAAILLTACADKPIRVPGGTFVEEPYTGETTTKTHTVISNGEEITDTEVIFIDDEVPVGPVEDKTQAGKQDGASAAQGGSSAQGGDASAQQGTTTLQPVDQDQTAKSNAPEGSVEYKVVKGDTLWGIGMVYGVSVARLAEINGIDEKAPLKVGQVLMIPPDAKNAVGKPVEKKQEKKQETKPATTSATTTTKPATATKAQPVAKDGETLYVVKSGDNLSMIAYRHHVKLADLVAANKVDPKATLRVGQTLVIPAAGAKAATTTTTKPATTTKTEPASTTKTEPATTKPATTSQTKGGEGSGGVVEPIGGSSMGGNSGSASASTSTPATSSTASSGLASVSALDDADVISVQIDSESTLEEVANIHDRNLEDLIRLNPEFKSGQKIPAGTAVKMPLF
ncbi:MAG: LysM peptidoglycan-binding domain-containing protein [Lentisphaeria bacterium]|nr:LysM peptidoglycan-binding domain-containing protein [Lentisphaeria bacterium]